MAALDDYVASLSPALSPFRLVRVVEMPCCGFEFAADHVDDRSGPVEEFDPFRWTCPECDRTWVAGPQGLEEQRSQRSQRSQRALDGAGAAPERRDED